MGNRNKKMFLGALKYMIYGLELIPSACIPAALMGSIAEDRLLQREAGMQKQTPDYMLIVTPEIVGGGCVALVLRGCAL